MVLVVDLVVLVVVLVVLAVIRLVLVIAPASLGNGAGRLGAARLALERLPGRQG